MKALKTITLSVFAFVLLLLVISNLYLHIKINNVSATPNQSQVQSSKKVEPSTLTKEDRKKAITRRADAKNALGCDVSHWDGKIDWEKLKQTDIAFVYIKATQGTNYIDPTFREHWASAKQHGFIRGAYHFYDPTKDPVAQAEFFLKTTALGKGDLLPVLDIEIAKGVDAQKLTNDIALWINTVKAKIGRNPMIYTDYGFWNKSIDKAFSDCPLWIAEWESGRKPYLPNGWKEWVFWQYSAKGSLEGISAKGNVDLDEFNGPLSSLKTYLLR